MWQPGLFTAEQEAKSTGAARQPEQESFGKRAKTAYSREAKYQKTKNEMDTLQRQWTKSRPKRDAEREELRLKAEALKNAAPQTVVLVSCASRKLPAAAEAKELYVSPLFKKARVYAEDKGDVWFILSARHGLLAPDDRIEPYNQTLIGLRQKERQAWAEQVARDLRRRVPPASTIIILAGNAYRTELIPLLEKDYRLEIPLKGLGILSQLSFLKKANAAS